MKKHCNVLSILSIVVGVVSTVVSVVRVKDNGFVWILVILLTGGILTYFLVLPWAIYAEILERLEFLQSKVDDLSRSQQDVNQSVMSVVEAGNIWDNSRSAVRLAGKWKCPACGRVNDAYIGTCPCGRDRPGEASEQGVQASPFRSSLENRFCPSCGKPLEPGKNRCIYCGNKVEG